MKTADVGNGERRRTSWDDEDGRRWKQRTTADKLGRGGDQRYGEIYPERITRDDKENPENPTQSTPYDPP
jgi:hypothetical protein